MFNFIEAKFARDTFRESVRDLVNALGTRRLSECKNTNGLDQTVTTALGFVIINYEKLLNTWDTHPSLTPPDKIIRDFNKYFFSEDYKFNHLEALAIGLTLEAKTQYLKYMVSLLCYYKRKFDEFEGKEDVLINNFSVDRFDMELRLSLFVSRFCNHLSIALDKDELPKNEKELIKRFIDGTCDDWGIRINYGRIKWGIWWFIDQKYSDAQKTLAQVNREKLGDYSGYSKAEMNNGTLTVLDLVSGKTTVFNEDDFCLENNKSQYQNHLINKEKLDDRWDNFAQSDFSSDSKNKQELAKEIERVHYLEMECYSRAYKAYEDVRRKSEGNIGKVIRIASALTLSECINQFVTYYIRNEKVSYSDEKVNFENRLLILALAINGYYLNFYRDFFIFDDDTENLLGTNFCREIDPKTTYSQEFLKKETTLPIWALSKRYPKEFEESLNFLKKFNTLIYYTSGSTFDLYSEKRSLHNDEFRRFISGINSGFLQPYLGWRYPIPMKGSLSEYERKGIWPDTNKPL